jgi:hypothetical protein
MITQRDKQILKFIELYGGITINQCSKVFFNKTKHSYDLARKRMRKIMDMTDIKYFTNKITGERVYCDNKKLTPHAIYVLDVLATFVQNGATVLEFTKEPSWLDGKYRSDAFFKIEYNGVKRVMFLEVDVMHSTDMTKYEEIYASGYFQNIYNGNFPLVIIVGDVTTDYNNDNFDSVFIDYNLNGFVEKVLAL